MIQIFQFQFKFSLLNKLYNTASLYRLAVYFFTSTPELLNGFSYKERIKYANLMMKIIAGDDIDLSEEWYPECRE